MSTASLPDRVGFLRTLLGEPPDETAVLNAALLHPPGTGTDEGRWEARTFGSIGQLAAFLDEHADSCEVYASLAWFRPGGGSTKAVLRAKRCISEDVDAKAMPGGTPEERLRQARSLVGTIPAPFVLVETGNGFHVHLLLPEKLRLEVFDTPADGVAQVELLSRALRVYLEQQSHELFGTPVKLDHCHGAERVWRVPPGLNCKSLADGKVRTAVRAEWRAVNLLMPGKVEGLDSLADADLTFLTPFLDAAEEEAERKGGSTATFGAAKPGIPGSDESSVAAQIGRAIEFRKDWLPLHLRASWPMPAGDQSAHDFAVAAGLLEEGWSPETARGAVRHRRSLLSDPEDRAKGERLDYVERTVEAALATVRGDAVKQTILPFEPFPTQILPPTVRNFVEQGAAAMNAAPEAILVPLLCAFGAAIGNSRRISLKSTWSEPAVIWGVVVLPSGALKTPAQRLALAFLQRREGDAIRKHKEEVHRWQAEEIAFKAALAAWKQTDATERDPEPPRPPSLPTAKRSLVSDITVEALAVRLAENPRGVLMVRDELAGWFGSFNAYRGGLGGDLQQWLSMFNAVEILVDRKGEATARHVEFGFVGVCGGIQPGPLRRILGQAHFEDGLASRFLMTYPAMPLKRWTETVVPAPTMEAMECVFDSLLALTPEYTATGGLRPIAMPLTDAAKALWRTRYDAFAARQAAITDSFVGSAYSKLEAYTARFALLYSLVHAACRGVQPPSFVDAESLTAGIATADWFAREAERVYRLLRESEADQDLRGVLDWIGGRGGSTTARDLARGPRKYRELKVATQALDALVRSGALWKEPVPPPSTGGWAQLRYVLRDALGPTEPRASR